MIPLNLFLLNFNFIYGLLFYKLRIVKVYVNQEVKLMTNMTRLVVEVLFPQTNSSLFIHLTDAQGKSELDDHEINRLVKELKKGEVSGFVEKFSREELIKDIHSRNQHKKF